MSNVLAASVNTFGRTLGRAVARVGKEMAEFGPVGGTVLGAGLGSGVSLLLDGGMGPFTAFEILASAGIYGYAGWRAKSGAGQLVQGANIVKAAQNVANGGALGLGTPFLIWGAEVAQHLLPEPFNFLVPVAALFGMFKGSKLGGQAILAEAAAKKAS